MILDIFKKTNKHGNYPLPKKELSDKEQERRREHNYRILYKEVYIPNPRIEEIIGMKMNTDNAHVCRDITDEEILECYRLLSKEMLVISAFHILVCNEACKIMDACIASMNNKFDTIPNGKDCVLPEIDCSLYSVERLRELYKQAMENPQSDKNPLSLDELIKQLKETKEERVKQLNQCLDLSVLMNYTFVMVEPSMCYTHGNFYGASEPLYDIY